MPQPLFFNQINYVKPIEVAFHRGLWSFIFLFIILLFFLKIKDFFLIFFSIKKLIFLSITGILISINWTAFIFAVSVGRVQDASMGYFITPMISICLGYFFLKEQITLLKFISLLLMISSIFFLLISNNIIPFLALLIAFTWGIYGVLRKQIDVSPAIGLLYESFFLSLFAIPYLIFIYINGSGYFLTYNSYTSVLLILTGAVTIFPLFFFNLGIKNIPLGFAGVLFYIAPTFHFITSVFILKEDLIMSKFISFLIIWIAIAIFIYDQVKKENVNVNNTQ
ncbi:MAG: hypothetical protein CFH16_00689 [Alphaproteobacteria bacterium MarineAlpha5_Bin6]|nr:MAG: hypothetical protein CFH17_00261 [Alphaproteobacteria bacterium MarineAlpha5_Bin7]PPR53996.1 MAG: hypothetical protein CFH16_00689 [Alphaproteobacteria bacterium MarineAlpha5_Bin6]|tara:strand:- start:1698 stop:2537 length:840 start_codon:yes stop_codon:yes gene_type:complete